MHQEDIKHKSENKMNYTVLGLQTQKNNTRNQHLHETRREELGKTNIFKTNFNLYIQL